MRETYGICLNLNELSVVRVGHSHFPAHVLTLFFFTLLEIIALCTYTTFSVLLPLLEGS